MWPQRELLDRLAIELPIVQAPMAGANDATLGDETLVRLQALATP